MARDPLSTNNIDKALLRAPAAANSLEEADILEQENALFTDTPVDVEVTLDDDPTGGATVDFGGAPAMDPTTAPFDSNLADLLDPAELSAISIKITSAYEDDKNSREDWEDTYSKGLELLGLRYDVRTEPFTGATGVVHPLLNEAVTQFQAGAYKELIPANGPVKTKVMGVSTPDMEARADRVKDYMNYQLMYEMDEYEPEFDQMLYYLGCAGSAFKKVYQEEQLGRPVSKFVPAEDLVVPYSATDIKTSERVTHFIKMSSNEVRKLQVSGFYRDVNIMPMAADERSEITEAYDKIEGTSPTYAENDQEITLLECHCYLDLETFPDTDPNGDPTGIKLPYIVTVCKDNGEVLSLRRNYMEQDPKKAKIEYFVHYKFSPGMGFYGFGLIHLLGNLSRTATSTLRQLVDAGTLSNLPAGFKTRGMRISDDDSAIQPGEWRDVDVPSNNLRESLLPLPYKEPSTTLFNLMGFVVSAAEKFVGTQEIGVAEGRGDLPVGTTVALLERGSKVMSAVHKRLHASLKNELKLLGTLFGELATQQMQYPYTAQSSQPQGPNPQLLAEDFGPEIDILPVSDPNIFSMAQRVMLAQEQLTMATSNPAIHNMYEAYRRVYSALGIDNIDEILKPQQDPKPENPAVENGRAPLVLTGSGNPLKVFAEQDHDAHIAAHTAFMESKIVRSQMPVYALMVGHIYEHFSFKAEAQAAQELQQQGIQPSEETRPQYEGRVAQLIAQFTKQFNDVEEQLQGGTDDDDPLVSLKNRELDIREGELARKAQEDRNRLNFDKQKQQQDLMLGRERIESTEDIAQLRANIALDRTHNAPKRGGGE
tara:strand:+ start:491 stop:2959 length:2469 start_codon:yes stop_codon:yes gene_type:complete